MLINYKGIMVAIDTINLINQFIFNCLTATINLKIKNIAGLLIGLNPFIPRLASSNNLKEQELKLYKRSDF